MAFATTNGTASKRTVTHKKDTRPNALKPDQQIRVVLKPRPPIRPLDQSRARARNPRAPPTYPFLAYATVKDRKRNRSPPRKNGPND